MQDDARTIADIYNEFGESYHNSRKKASGRLHNEFIDVPTTIFLLPSDLKKTRILDAGCGSGIYAKMMAEKGANVTGIDVSSKMLEIAQRETPEEYQITYLIGDLYNLPFGNNSFDIVICTYVLENIKDILKIFQEFYRVLVPNGICIFSISHPIRANSVKESKDGKEVWTITDYFDEGMRLSDFGDGMVVPKYKRSIQSYVTALSSAGFVIQSILEPQPDEGGKQVDEKGYEKAMRLPQLLAMRLLKQ